VQVLFEDRIDRVRAQWAEERPELDTSPMEIVGRILRAEHLADAEMRRTFQQHGLDRGGFDVLATLRRSGLPYRLTPTRLAEELVLTSGAMTHRVDTLVRAGFVERVPDERDRRSTLVGLTAKGRSVVDRAMDAHMDGEARMIAHLPPAERLALIASLKRLLQGMEGRHGSD
jgi:DNA-binding MarR family transcriptional regulator